MPKVDAVALACIPDAFAGLTGMSREDLVAQWFKHEPRLGNVYELPGMSADGAAVGKIGLIVLPTFELDIFKDEARLRKSITHGVEMAAKMGAKTVSLTGMLPSATDYGREIQTWFEDRKDLPKITTGDATRTATIIKTVEGVLEKTGRKFAQERVAFVGLRSIGMGTVKLALEVLPHPKEILLCDPYMSAEQLDMIRREVKESGYKGQITVHPNGGGLPASVYAATFVIGTTSIPGILDVGKLPSGAIIVDYSFPPSFRIADAVRRFEETNDLLFTTGGELHLDETIKETIYLPQQAQALSSLIDNRHITLLAGRDPKEITGCIVVSLLTNLQKDVKPTQGPVSPEDVLAHYQFLAKRGFKPARLQMHRYFLDPKRISKFGKVKVKTVGA